MAEHGDVFEQIERDNVRFINLQFTDIVGMVKGVTKYAVTVDDPQSIRYHLERALHLATAPAAWLGRSNSSSRWRARPPCISRCGIAVYTRNALGMGCPVRSISQRIDTIYQRLTSRTSWMLLIPRSNAVVSLTVWRDS